MKKLYKKLNHTLFDVAGGPIILIALGIPFLIIIGVIILVWVAVALIRKAYVKGQQGGKAETTFTDNFNADAYTGADIVVHDIFHDAAETGSDTVVHNHVDTDPEPEIADNSGEADTGIESYSDDNSDEISNSAEDTDTADSNDYSSDDSSQEQ